LPTALRKTQPSLSRKMRLTGGESLSRSDSLFSKIVLGLVVAATGVGAGDLITASLAGSEVGLAKTRSYRAYLVALSVLPLTLLWLKVQQVQLVR